jgi:uncharacterized Ntn-hydrolase superfamily protein
VTFSLVARCERTGQVGVGVATSDIAVGSRVPHAAAGVGAIATQHRTDPRLGPRGLALLRSGCDAAATVAALVASTPHHAWRQLAVVDARGDAVTFSGDRVQPIFTDLRAGGCAAIGNMLASDRVGPAYRARVDEFVLRALDPDRVDAEVLA